MAECLSQTHTEEAAAALKASLPLVPLKGSLEICSEIGRKKTPKKPTQTEARKLAGFAASDVAV